MAGRRHQSSNEVPGVHQVYSKSEVSTAWNGPAYLPQMVRWLETDTAPSASTASRPTSDNSAYMTEAELGTRLSGGCQRQANADAGLRLGLRRHRHHRGRHLAPRRCRRACSRATVLACTNPHRTRQHADVCTPTCTDANRPRVVVRVSDRTILRADVGARIRTVRIEARSWGRRGRGSAGGGGGLDVFGEELG